jgi:hypothetical protein
MRLPRETSLVLLCLLCLSPEALSAKPAVKELNGRVFGGYSYENIDRGAQSAGNSSVTVPGSKDGAWRVGGAVTAPLLDWLGGRLLLAGGQSSLDLQSDPGIAGSTVDSGGIDMSATLFARDPELGHVDVGYRFGWQNPSGSIVDRGIVHGVDVGAGFYIPDLGAGPIDWDAFFSYGRASLRSPVLGDDVDEFTVGGAMGWYLVNSLRLSGGVRWLESVPRVARSSRDLRGFGEIAWLLPFGARRNVTVGVFGSGGSIERNLASPFSTIRQPVWSVGGSLTFSYPGAASLVELIREYH